MVQTMKYKRLQISAELFLSWFTAGKHLENGYEVTKDGLPADVRLVHVRHAWPNFIELLLSSETFEEVKKGEEIPLILPIMTLLTPPTLRSEQ